MVDSDRVRSGQIGSGPEWSMALVHALHDVVPASPDELRVLLVAYPAGRALTVARGREARSVATSGQRLAPTALQLNSMIARPDPGGVRRGAVGRGTRTGSDLPAARPAM